MAPMRKRGHLRAARLVVSALSKVFRTALKDPTLGLFGNPCSGVEVGRKAGARPQPLSADERKRFREAIAGTTHEALWLLMMMTGLGPGEALALDWKHVDLERAELRVKQTLDCSKGEIIDDTKRPSRKRALPVVPELRAVLRERWMAAGRPAEGLLFANAEGKPLDLHNLRSRHFRPLLDTAKIARPARCRDCGRADLASDAETCACGSAKLARRSIRIYDLRHGFATAALEADADVRTVADLMGHSSTRITQDVYQHVSSERKREAAERIAERLSQ